jgi:gas vesicle protein
MFKALALGAKSGAKYAPQLIKAGAKSGAQYGKVAAKSGAKYGKVVAKQAKEEIKKEAREMSENLKNEAYRLQNNLKATAKTMASNYVDAQKRRIYQTNRGAIYTNMSNGNRNYDPTPAYYNEPGTNTYRPLY